jgi:hypothetical protein
VPAGTAAAPNYLCGLLVFVCSWLKFQRDIEFRTNNTAWLQAVDSFVTAVAREVEPHLARNGGPIVLAQIENEYGSQEASYGAGGQVYVAQMAQLMRDLNLQVPTVMCVQLDAPQDVINTCNGFYCDEEWSTEHAAKNPGQPHFWTENWNGWFQHWGEGVPHRPLEDTLYGVARWIMANGTLHNYYMVFGGTSFGRTVGGPNIATTYDYDGQSASDNRTVHT